MLNSFAVLPLHGRESLEMFSDRQRKLTGRIITIHCNQCKNIKWGERRGEIPPHVDLEGKRGARKGIPNKMIL